MQRPLSCRPQVQVHGQKQEVGGELATATGTQEPAQPATLR